MIHAQLIQKFYSAFASKNIEDMIDCYHDDIRFEDPAFGILEGNRAKSMWRMLLKNNKSKLDRIIDGLDSIFQNQITTTY